MASSIALSTTSLTRWCRPRELVVPMYMPGRLRTGSSPSSTWMLLESYAAVRFLVLVANGPPFDGAQTSAEPGRAEPTRGRAGGVRGEVARTTVILPQPDDARPRTGSTENSYLPAVSHSRSRTRSDLARRRGPRRPCGGSPRAGTSPARPRVRSTTSTVSTPSSKAAGRGLGRQALADDLGPASRRACATGMPRLNTCSRSSPSTISPIETASPDRGRLRPRRSPSSRASGPHRRRHAAPLAAVTAPPARPRPRVRDAGTSASSATDTNTWPPRSARRVQEPVAPRGIERAERVVDEQHRRLAELLGRPPTASPSRRQSAVAQVSPWEPAERAPSSRTSRVEVVAVRPDERGAPCELVATALGDARAERLLEIARRPLGRRVVGQTFGLVAHEQLVAGEMARTPRRRAGRGARRRSWRACGQRGAGLRRAARPRPRARAARPAGPIPSAGGSAGGAPGRRR